VKYAIGIPAIESGEREIAKSLTPHVRRPNHRRVVKYRHFLHRAASWKTARPVVTRVEFHHGELFPPMGLILTNLELPNRAMAGVYDKRPRKLSAIGCRL